MLAAWAMDTESSDDPPSLEGVAWEAPAGVAAAADADAAPPAFGVVLAPLSLVLLLGLLRTELLLMDDSNCREPLVFELGCVGSMAQANVACVGDVKGRELSALRSAVENAFPMDRPRTERMPLLPLLLLRMGLAGVGGGSVDTRVAMSVTRPPLGVNRSALERRFCSKTSSAGRCVRRSLRVAKSLQSRCCVLQRMRDATATP